MPYRGNVFAKGSYYHVFNRGVNHQNIFYSQENYKYCLKLLKKYSGRYFISIIAYCLMPNHYHFLVRQDGEIPAGELPKRVFGGYSRAVNRRYGWSGTLFEGRFQARHVKSDDYLRHLCRYIHANPVKDGMVEHPEEWIYSNYPEWIGLREGMLVDHEFIIELFGDSVGYEEFVKEYLLMQGLPDELNYLT